MPVYRDNNVNYNEVPIGAIFEILTMIDFDYLNHLAYFTHSLYIIVSNWGMCLRTHTWRSRRNLAPFKFQKNSSQTKIK
jgi:hypothetical protein